MEEKKTQEIIIHVEDENELYAPFSNRTEFSDDLSSYVISRLDTHTKHPGAVFRIKSAVPLDETCFRAAFGQWIEMHKAQIRKDRKNNFMKQLWMLCVGIVFIALSLLVSPTDMAIRYTILTTIGSFAIWEAAAVWIIERPENRRRNLLLQKFAEGCTLIFDYETD